jgi:YidC/Oxa1 family membrane protein insertase
MFDPVYEFLAQVLSFFYDLIPNYAVAIALLTLVVMVVTTPFTLKGTRSMIQMQRLQPEMRKLQIQYKDDRQKLNEELMAFYKENNLNPLGGCLPLLLQAPVFFFLYHVLQGLTNIPDGAETFDPKYLDESSQMYQDLSVTNQMMAFGIDLSQSASKALSEGFLHGLPYIMLVLIVALSSYYQQRQIQGRNPNADIPQQQQMIMKLLPLMMVFFSFVAPAALVVYFVVSNLYRIGMQYYITRTLYHGEDSLGAQAQRATAEAKKLSDAGGGPDLMPRIGKKARATEEAAEGTTKKAPAAPPSSGANGASAPAPTARTNQNRSKKKKKRR